MKLLHYDQLPQGGFAGLKERRIVTDSRAFGSSKHPLAAEGIGNFIYLADAQFLPHGETGMHPHHEIDVISVMVEGRVSHQGSLEHGKGLESGYVQVQRAGAEGFSHNEVNPDDAENRMIQLWVMPDKRGEAAGYKVYQPSEGGVTRIYGGKEAQKDTFYSETLIDIAVPTKGQIIEQEGEVMVYLTKGEGIVNDSRITAGSLIRTSNLHFQAVASSQLILIYTHQ
ncbi:pirin family protein [Aliikangiella coralliicola]|uniref:Pilus assembly protein n=1 Tax=Aliikangiella coralliicola TaxID=2592383 RepID=A0A545UGC2_9GAMM|nr:pirin family protein [Aliikangiella coralliicola]TQV88507.1 pilus assembly protein [Aliikangiella coralliicola]